MQGHARTVWTPMCPTAAPSVCLYMHALFILFFSWHCWVLRAQHRWFSQMADTGVPQALFLVELLARLCFPRLALYQRMTTSRRVLCLSCQASCPFIPRSLPPDRQHTHPALKETTPPLAWSTRPRPPPPLLLLTLPATIKQQSRRPPRPPRPTMKPPTPTIVLHT